MGSLLLSQPLGTRHAPPPSFDSRLEREMDTYYKQELAGVSPLRLQPCRLTPKPLAYEAQVVAANPIQHYDHLINDGQALRSPSRGVSDDNFNFKDVGRPSSLLCFLIALGAGLMGRSELNATSRGAMSNVVSTLSTEWLR